MPPANSQTYSDTEDAAQRLAEIPRNERERAERLQTTNGSNGPSGQSGLRSIGEFGPNSIKARLQYQREMFETFEDISRAWLARATTETELVFALPARLTAARTVPDAVSAYQEWLTEWMNMIGEDSRLLLTDGGKVMGAGARCFAGASPAVTT